MRTQSGFWDGSDDPPGLVEMSAGVGMPPRRLELAPRGFGRPWYPLVTGRAVIEATHDRTPTEDGEPNLTVNYNFRYVDGPHRTRVGVRRWFKMTLRHLAERGGAEE